MNDIGQALDNQFAINNGSIVDVTHPVRGSIKTLACPIRCPGEQLPLQPAPRLGADTDEVLRSLNNDDEWIASLTRSNVI